MSYYIGATPTTGDFKRLDSISTSATDTFNLRQGGNAVYPQSKNHVLIILNGVLQSWDAFEIVNDTVVFSESLTSSDVINGILVLGNVNDIGTPSDDTCSQAKIQNEAINEAKMQISNAGTNGQFLQKQSSNTGGLTWADAGGDLSFGGDTFGADKTIGSNDAYALSFETNNAVGLKIDNAGHVTKPLQPAFFGHASGGSAQTITNGSLTTLSLENEAYDINADFNTSTYTFTAPVTGKYQISGHFSTDLGSGTATQLNQIGMQLTSSNRNYRFFPGTGWTDNHDRVAAYGSALIDMDANDTVILQGYCTRNSGTGASTSLVDSSYFSWMGGHLVC